jgi:hypothetical protein
MAYTTIGQDETSPLSNSIGKLAKINDMSSQQTKELVTNIHTRTFYLFTNNKMLQ